MNHPAKKIFFVLSFVFQVIYHHSFSQCSIRGSVTDSIAAPVPFIAVALLKDDSTIYKGEFTNEKGEFCFSKIGKGNYFIKISAMNYADYYGPKINYDTTSAMQLGDIILQKNGVSLSEVSISAIRNPIEFKGGNITVNVQDSPLAIGNSVFDLIAHLPGVVVEGDNISIQGKAGVRVYIDDRAQQLSGAQLANFLRSMSASTVEKIEIITNPPSRYDAAGNAGIINIKTKKVKITGPSGGLNYTASQGFYTTHTAGFSLNYKGEKATFFSNTSFYQGSIRHETDMQNHVSYNGITTTMDQQAHETEDSKYMTVAMGADWYLNEKNTIGARAQIVPGHAVRTYEGTTYMSDNSMGYDRLIYTRPMDNNWLLCNFNVNTEHVFDTLGTKLKFSMDYYGPYDDKYKVGYQNRFIGLNGSDVKANQDFRTSNNLGIHILAPRLDFEKKFKNNMSMEAGLKYSNQRAVSDYTCERRNPVTGDYIVDPLFSNKFTYAEQISAGYVSMDKQYKKMNFRLGLRGEHTNIQAWSVSNTIRYTRQYANLFPNVSVGYNPTTDHSLSFSYNRRIDRPDYNSFNPFRSFISILTSSEGNPYLMPVYDHNFNFSYVYKNKVSNYLSYSAVNHQIQSYPTQNDSTKEVVTHLTNMDQLNTFRYNFFLRQELKKWWTITFLAGAYYLEYNGTINNLNFSAKAIPWYTRLGSVFTIKKNTKLEVSGFYWSPWLGDATVFLEREGLRMALRQSFLNNNLNISLSLNDIFFTEQFRQKADFQNQKWTLYEAHDTRRIAITITYAFGKIKAQEREASSADEEKGRLNH